MIRFYFGNLQEFGYKVYNWWIYGEEAVSSKLESASSHFIICSNYVIYFSTKKESFLW